MNLRERLSQIIRYNPRDRAVEQIVDLMLELQYLSKEYHRESEEFSRAQVVYHKLWGLARTESALLFLALRRETVRIETVLALLNSESPGSVHVRAVSLRKKLGIKISSVYGVGYSLSPEDKRRVLDALEKAA